MMRTLRHSAPRGQLDARRHPGQLVRFLALGALVLPVAVAPAAAQQTRVIVRTVPPPTSPDGWFGVDIQTTGTTTERGGRALVSTEYPRVVSVEPGSPAAEAGIQAGDRLLTIAGVDLSRESLDLNQLLRPGNRVPVSLEREGRRQEVTVVITQRPASFNPGTSVHVLAVGPESAAGVLPGEEGGVAGVGTRMATTQAGRGSGASPALVTWPGAAAGMRGGAPSPADYLFSASPSVLALAGAELMRPSRALQSALGVSDGVYVVTVAPRTPAHAAGVQPGDVLLRADGEPLHEPVDFYRVLREQRDGVVRLGLVRDRQPLELELRW